MSAPQDGPSQRPFGADATPLWQMTDKALIAEVEARRAKRARRGGSVPATKHKSEGPHTPVRPERLSAGLPKQVRQWLANLELDSDANLDSIETAYTGLLERYRPALKDDSPARRADAQALLASLKKAHEGLRVYFSRAR